MKLQFQHLRFGDAFGIHYRFSNEGDFIPFHPHTVETAHIVIVLKGAIQLLIDQDKYEAPRYEAGSIVEFDWKKRHLIAACEDGTEIFNLFLHGQPPGYEELPDHEKHGVIDLD